MRVSDRWLREFVDPGLGPDELALRLTMAGLEVGAIEPAGPALEGILVGLVVESGPHPNADRLSVCRVDAGDGVIRQIVCGAPNVYAGMKAPVALPGTVMPDGRKLGKAKLRGVESDGMLCSGAELGLSEDHAGILDLGPAAVAGTPLVTALGLDDRVYDIEITPNRGDCMSVLGVAREVAALTGQAVPVLHGAPVAATVDDAVRVKVADRGDCPVYCGRVVRDVDAMRKSPLWLQERLRRAGIRPVGAAVDVTALVMLETGQPMHAYDLARVAGPISVRRARAGESCALLDGRRVDLDPGVLVIADKAGVQGLAGVMGSADSAVGAGTRDVFLEAAHFTPVSVAGRARRFGLHTDAAQRFERGVDAALPPVTIERATRLLVDIAGGEPGPVRSTGRAAAALGKSSILLRRTRLESIYGGHATDAEVGAVLAGLGFAVRKARGGWRVRVPSWRFDVEREADLIEEVARMLGYDRIPSRDGTVPMTLEPVPEGRVPVTRLADTLVQRGYHEVITYSFVDPALQARLGGGSAALALANPMSTEQAEMRTSLWPGLVGCLSYNAKRQETRVRIFESGLRFISQDDELKQENMIAGLAWGDRYPAQWGLPAAVTDFHDLKADCAALLAHAGAAAAVRFEAAGHPALHPGQSARVWVDDRHAGWVGVMHPRLAGALDLAPAPVLFELALAVIETAPMPVARPVSRFPALRRDLAVVVDESVEAGQVLDAIDGIAPEWLRGRFIFDIYRGQGIEPGRKSIALGLILQESSRTLTDGEADAFVRGLVDHLREAVRATLRE